MINYSKIHVGYALVNDKNSIVARAETVSALLAVYSISFPTFPAPPPDPVREKDLKKYKLRIVKVYIDEPERAKDGSVVERKLFKCPKDGYIERKGHKCGICGARVVRETRKTANG